MIPRMNEIEIAAIPPAASTYRLFRRQRPTVMGLRVRFAQWALMSWAFVFAGASTSFAQLPAPSQTKTNVVRSIAVVEWIGPEGKPTASRLIPVAVYTDGQYMDGGLYLAQPAPLAVLTGTEYILQKSGIPQGYYDLDSAGTLHGDWFGLGTWKAVESAMSRNSIADAKHPRIAEDPNRPHFGSDATPAATQSGNKSSGPTLRKRSPNESAADTTPAVTGMANPANDPNRPILSYGKPARQQTPDLAQLKSTTISMHQMIAVSDSIDREPHPFAYVWGSEDQKNAMQKKLEVLAKTILQQAGAGTSAHPSATGSAVANTRRSGRYVRQKKNAAAAPDLTSIDFRSFALTYENNPTLVFSAETAGEGAEKHYLTLIAQPDIYDDPQVVLKSVTDAAHLDSQPRMKLVDVVDATASNRAEMLFELDGQSQRQFALYLVTPGSVRQVFVTSSLPL